MMTTLTARGTLFARAAIALMFASLFATGHVAARMRTDPPEQTVLRPANRYLRNVIAEGLLHSATLRSLVSRLESLNTIVYLDSGQPLGPNTLGRTRLMVATGIFRYIRTDLDDRLPRVDLLALLGHELRHAVEIAEHPSVVDEPTLIALYREIGSAHGSLPGNKQWFETDAAIATGRKVYLELFAPTR
jgi:hypothetical protein